MHARKPTSVLTVKGNDFGNFSVPRINVKRSNGYGTICFSCWKLNECTSMVLP